MANLTNKEQRELELVLARLAITDVFLEWDIGWFNLAPRQRRAALALAVLAYASGYTGCRSHEDIANHGWDALDCQEILSIIAKWSEGNFGFRMVEFALEDEAWPHDPIPALKARIARLR